MKVAWNECRSSGKRLSIAPRASNSSSFSALLGPAIELMPRPFLTENLSNYKLSISSALIRLCRGVMVSLLDEKTRSQGTEEAWIGRTSIAMANSVG